MLIVFPGFMVRRFLGKMLLFVGLGYEGYEG